MHLIVIDGIMGAGKTILMTLLAKYFQELGAVKGINVDIYSNYEFYDTKPFHSFENFLDVSKSDSSIICLDESHLDLDSRSFSSNSVKYFSHMIFYLRKLRTTIIMTSPIFESLDSRVHLVTHIYVHAYKKKEYIHYELYDMQRNILLKTVKLKRSDVINVGGSLFNTKGFVVPLTFPDDKKQYNNVLRQLKFGDEFLMS